MKLSQIDKVIQYALKLQEFYYQRDIAKSVEFGKKLDELMEQREEIYATEETCEMKLYYQDEAEPAVLDEVS